MNEIRTVSLTASALPVRRVLAVVGGALLVALGAQIAVPVSGTPVPITFQVPAVLVVGGLLGARLGAASMVVYLLAGMLGLPVFAAGGVPGLARLLGPTGGYLLAFPVAAALVGWVAARVPGTTGGRVGNVVLGIIVGFAAIHIGGVAQLAVLTGDVGTAFVWGSLPFLAGDVIKLVLAGLLVWRFGPHTRARL